jgi:hypothetical protein
MTDLFEFADTPEEGAQRRRINYQETSRLAWRALVPLGAALDRAILEEIERHGEHGIVCADIESAICRSHQAVSGNLRHLVERGLVEHSGEHGKTPSGRRAMCWRIKR